MSSAVAEQFRSKQPFSDLILDWKENPELGISQKSVKSTKADELLDLKL